MYALPPPSSPAEYFILKLLVITLETIKFKDLLRGFEKVYEL